MTARAPAKVNLQLSVGPPRGDGYHDLVTVYHAVSLFDEVTVAEGRGQVVVAGEGAAEVPTDDTNLAVRAVRALARATGCAPAGSPGVRITISKRIPVAAGLAGGSADAAAALVAANELWRAGLSQGELSQIAATVGSDVAFALTGGTAVGMGRGERVTSALAHGTYHWVLGFADGGVSTGAVYAACDRIRERRPSPPASPSLDLELMAALRGGDATGLGRHLHNDLQAAAVSLHPALRRALAAGEEYGALGTIVSGSGPTCAYLAKDARHARDLAAALAGEGVCRAVAPVAGPVPGACVVRGATGAGEGS